MKKKFLLPILSVCMVVALVSVGFAAWLITGNDATEGRGQFVTYDVQNNYFSVTAHAKDTTKITFGKDGSPSDPWLTVTDVADQVLTKKFTITITPEVPFAEGRDVSTLLGTDVVKVKLSGLAKNETATTEGTTAKLYADAVYNGILGNPSIESGSIKSTTGDLTAGVEISLPATSFAVQADDKTATAEVTVTFAWGSNGNPYTYYNGLENNQANRKAATDALGFVKLLNEKTYYICLEVGANA